MLFSRILVAVDGSESAGRAFKEAIYLAQKCNSTLDVIHVIDDSSYGGDSANTFELIEGLKSRGRRLLEQCRSQAAGNNVQAGTLLKLGDHAQVIIDIANKNDYDLIMMGSRGLSAFKELLLGSV
jgi:nucleotide-binding universal stress UspA family protein